MKYEILYCGNEDCPGFLGHWPVAEDEGNEERFCPECKRIGLVDVDKTKAAEQRHKAQEEEKAAKQGSRRVKTTGA